tara:strand:+ start:1157 stop:1729 length:573 start_codon:yes stop_codon:yes gene_type:complete
MDKRIVIALLISFFFALTNVSAGNANAGEDVNPNDDEVPFTILSRDSPSVDSQSWSLKIRMNDDAYQNNTTFEITTQICLNDGVCDPPVQMDADVDGQDHGISLTPPSDHTYVNWRVKAIYEDGNYTNYPLGDWYKTWSSCWYQDGVFGGSDSTDDGCSTEDESMPGFEMFLATSAIISAAVFCRKIDHQ